MLLGWSIAKAREARQGSSVRKGPKTMAGKMIPSGSISLFCVLAFACAVPSCSTTDDPNGVRGPGGASGSPGAGGSSAGAPGVGGSGVGGSGGASAGLAGSGQAGVSGGGGGDDAGQAGAGTGGVRDGGNGDATNDGPMVDPCATALYCDNFDSYTAPGNPGGMWRTSVQAGGTVSVDTTHARSGANAVHVTNPGGAAYERAFISLEGAPIFPIANNTIFGRMMIYVTRVPATTVHWTMIQGEGTRVAGFPNITDAVYRYGGQINGNRLMANYDTVPGGQSDCAQRSQVLVPMNTWSCVEWRFDGVLKELDFWLDGTIIPALSVRRIAVPAAGACQNPNWSGVWEPPTFEAIRLGWQHYQQGPGEAWIDDVGIDTKRLGCPSTP